LDDFSGISALGYNSPSGSATGSGRRGKDMRSR
jgi:hypothetical protein